MKIQHLKISNILGIKHLEITPGGTLTEIAGENGQGKTSILEAVKAATQTGHDATLLRHGAEKGEIVLVLDDGVELHKRVSAGRSTLDLIKDGQKIKAAADTIKGLTDLLSVNPVDFLSARGKKRVEMLLETMPVKVDVKHLSEISGMPINAQDGIDGLALIDMVHKQVFEDRTMTNRAAKEKDATINQMRLGMPEAPGGIEGDEDDIRAQLAAAQDDFTAEQERIRVKLEGLRTASTESIAALRADAREKHDAIKAEAQAKLDALQAELEQAVQAERDALAETEGKAARQKQKTADAHQAKIQPLQVAIQGIATNRDVAAKRKVTLETLEQMAKDLEGLQMDAAAQTQALEAIQAYKSKLLDDLPIPGLEVRDGEVYRNGVTFDRLNTAQQVEIAIEIAALRAGDLAVCCVDRFECLSPDTFEAFKVRAEQLGLQLFVTRVEPGELTVRTE